LLSHFGRRKLSDRQPSFTPQLNKKSEEIYTKMVNDGGIAKLRQNEREKFGLRTPTKDNIGE